MTFITFKGNFQQFLPTRGWRTVYAQRSSTALLFLESHLTALINNAWPLNSRDRIGDFSIVPQSFHQCVAKMTGREQEILLDPDQQGPQVYRSSERSAGSLICSAKEIARLAQKKIYFCIVSFQARHAWSERHDEGRSEAPYLQILYPDRQDAELMPVDLNCQNNKIYFKGIILNTSGIAIQRTETFLSGGLSCDKASAWTCIIDDIYLESSLLMCWCSFFIGSETSNSTASAIGMLQFWMCSKLSKPLCCLPSASVDTKPEFCLKVFWCHPVRDNTLNMTQKLMICRLPDLTLPTLQKPDSASFEFQSISKLWIFRIDFSKKPQSALGKLPAKLTFLYDTETRRKESALNSILTVLTDSSCLIASTHRKWMT